MGGNTTNIRSNVQVLLDWSLPVRVRGLISACYCCPFKPRSIRDSGTDGVKTRGKLTQIWLVKTLMQTMLNRNYFLFLLQKRFADLDRKTIINLLRSIGVKIRSDPDSR
jgi:hypothetical protein